MTNHSERYNRDRYRRKLTAHIERLKVTNQCLFWLCQGSAAIAAFFLIIWNLPMFALFLGLATIILGLQEFVLHVLLDKAAKEVRKFQIEGLEP